MRAKALQQQVDTKRQTDKLADKNRQVNRQTNRARAMPQRAMIRASASFLQQKPRLRRQAGRQERCGWLFKD